MCLLLFVLKYKIIKYCNIIVVVVVIVVEISLLLMGKKKQL